MDDEKREGEDRPEGGPPERHLRLVPRKEKPERRSTTRRNAGWALASLATLAILVGGLSLMEPARPGPELPGDRGQLIGFQRDLPPDTGDIQVRVHALRGALQAGDWAAIEETSTQLQQTWVAYRPGMQGFAGSRAWTTYHIDDFEEALTRLERRVDARDLAGTNEEVEKLEDILRNYLTTPQRLEEQPNDPQPMPPGASG